MEINILNKEFEKIAIVDNYSSLMWCKRYYDIGALDLQIEATIENINLFKQGYYITRDDDETVFIIKCIHIDTEENHDNNLIVGAVDIKSILSQRIIWNTIIFNGTVENYIRKMITENIIDPKWTGRQISNFKLKDERYVKGIITQQCSYDNLGEKVIDLCRNYNLGWKVTLEDGVFYFDMYEGINRSINQTENNPIVFSPRYENLTSSVYDFNSTEYKNAALIGGQGEGKDRVLTSVENGAGLERFEIFVDDSSSSSNSETEITEEEYLSQLQAKGKEELAKCSITTEFEGEIVVDSYEYKKEYDLGDIITIENEYGISVDARIVEVVETWDDTGYSIEPVFEYSD